MSGQWLSNQKQSENPLRRRKVEKSLHSRYQAMTLISESSAEITFKIKEETSQEIYFLSNIFYTAY